MSALHFELIKSDLSVLKLREVLNRDPESVSTVDHLGRLPIHIACYYDMPRRLYAIIDLVDFYPESLLVRDFSGKLPIHAAIRNNTKNLGATNYEIIYYLANRCTESLHIQSNDGCLPLHYLCGTYNEDSNEESSNDENNDDDNVENDVDDDVDDDSDNSEESDGEESNVSESIADMNNVPNENIGNHDDAQGNDIEEDGNNTEIVVTERNYYEEFGKVYDNGEYTDYNDDYALYSDYSDDSKDFDWLTHLIIDIVDKYPGSLNIKNSKNKLPIHLACQNEFIEGEAVCYMAQTCPKSLLVNTLPLHIAIRRMFRANDKYMDLSILYKFTRLQPDSVHIKSVHGDAFDLIHACTRSKIAHRIIQNSSLIPPKNTFYRYESHDLNWRARRYIIYTIYKIQRTSAVTFSSSCWK